MKIRKIIAKFSLFTAYVLISCVVSSPPVQANIYNENKIPKKIEKQIEKIVNAPSNLEGIGNFKRKSKNERLKDNIAWYKKHGTVNEEYNIYGLDIKNYRNQNDYATGKDLNRSALHHKNINPKKYKRLLDDKILFDERVRKHYPEALADVYFEFSGKNIIPTQNALLGGFKDTQSALESLNNGKYFIKQLDGLGGRNAILLTKENSKMTFHHVSKGDITINDFWEITGKKNFIIQKHIENHSDIKGLTPTALSTVRIVTTRFNEKVNILSSDLCLGCSKDSIVDNYNNEGAIVHVDEKTGKLSKYAFRKNAKAMDKHPVSGIKFENYQLPFWKESIELVKKLHKIFPEFTSVGWDIAITENGPIIMEGNYNWGYSIPQTTMGGLKEKWKKAHNI